METTESYDYEDEDDVDYAEPDNGAIFSCPTANCMAEFLRYDRLQKHIIAGQCKLKKEVETTEEKVRTLYISAFGIGYPEKVGKNDTIKNMVAHLVGYPKAAPITGIVPQDTPLAPLSVPKNKLFKMGFALPQQKEKTHFSEKVLSFLWKIFEAGKFQGKAKPEEVVQRMKKEKVNGKLLFGRKEWLNDSQVKRLFGRFAAKQKKRDFDGQALDNVTDVEVEEEIRYQQSVNVAQIAEDLIEKVEDEDDIPDINQHPMILGEISLCDLARSISEKRKM